MAAKCENTFGAQGSSAWRRVMTHRTIEREGSFILPYLQQLPAAFTFFDVGCGPGSIPLSVALKFPSATVLGIDIDAKTIEEAKSFAAHLGIRNVRYAVGSATSLDAVASLPGFEMLNAGCDIVFEHVTLMHVADHVSMLKQMAKATKIGGYVACRDHDLEMNMIYPTSPALQEWDRVTAKLVAARGCDTQMGRKMVHYALAAGYSRDHLVAQTGDFSFSSLERRKLWAEGTIEMMSDERLIPMVKTSINYDFDEKMIAEGWRVWLDQEDGFFALFTTEMIWQKFE